MRLLLDLLALIRALAADRARLALENLVLRQQINILKRGVKRVRLEDSDRIFWVVIPSCPETRPPVLEQAWSRSIHAEVVLTSAHQVLPRTAPAASSRR